MIVVYIAGKMTGLEDNGRGNFAEAEKDFKERGFTVLNPAVLPDGMPGERYMPICFAMIDQADMVVLLNNWKDSPGATLEREYAKYQKKMVFEYDEAKGCECYAPTIDAEPVRHGRWVYGEDVDIQCSECGGDAMSDWMKYTQVYSNYCPHCGVKMDGGMKE